MEQWKPVVGYEGLYEVSSLGRVRSLARTASHWRGRTRTVPARILSTPLAGHAKWGGYPVAHLCKEGVAKMIYVHRLVAAAFIGPTGDLEVNHINGIKTDNRPENLELVTSRENIRHAVATGLRNLRGERNHKATLTEADVRAVRARLAAGETGAAIARSLGVLPGCVSKIKHGRSWAHLP